MQLINTFSDLVLSQFTAWQSEARARLLTFASDGGSVRSGSAHAFARAIRELRVQVSHEIAPADSEDMRDVIDDIVDAAERTAGSGLSAESHARFIDLTELGIESARNAMRDALRVDEQTVISAARKHLLRTQYAPSKGLPLVSFTHRSRSGARWETAKYARTLLRQLLVDTYTHALLLALKDSGRDQARVMTEGQWVTFSITGKTPGMPSMEAIEHLFHPNLQTMVEPA